METFTLMYRCFSVCLHLIIERCIQVRGYAGHGVANGVQIERQCTFEPHHGWWLRGHQVLHQIKLQSLTPPRAYVSAMRYASFGIHPKCGDMGDGRWEMGDERKGRRMLDYILRRKGIGIWVALIFVTAGFGGHASSPTLGLA